MNHKISKIKTTSRRGQGFTKLLRCEQNKTKTLTAGGRAVGVCSAVGLGMSHGGQNEPGHRADFCSFFSTSPRIKYKHIVWHSQSPFWFTGALSLPTRLCCTFCQSHCGYQFLSSLSMSERPVPSICSTSFFSQFSLPIFGPLG